MSDHAKTAVTTLNTVAALSDSKEVKLLAEALTAYIKAEDKKPKGEMGFKTGDKA